MIKKLFSTIIFSLVLCLFLFPTYSFAGQANLAWDPPDISTDVTGYMIHYGTASGTYSQAIDVGNTTSYTVSNLIDGQTYYFAVTAYNAVGYESVYSNEVSIAIAPAQYLLMISNPGPGQGTISGPGISCGDTCLAAYNAGTVVSLSAAAAPGSIFDGWSGGGCSGTGLCTVTMNANVTITANFKTASAPTTVPTTTTTSIPPTTTTSVLTTIPTTTIQPTTSTTSVLANNNDFGTHNYPNDNCTADNIDDFRTYYYPSNDHTADNDDFCSADNITFCTHYCPNDYGTANNIDDFRAHYHPADFYSANDICAYHNQHRRRQRHDKLVAEFDQLRACLQRVCCSRDQGHPYRHA